MFCRSLCLAACSLVLGLAGCTHNQGSAYPTTMATTDPATSESLLDKAKDLMKKGQAMLAQGKADNNPDEQSQGQSMIDKAKQLMQDYKTKMGM